jgi:hypothetical protein
MITGQSVSLGHHQQTNPVGLDADLAALGALCERLGLKEEWETFGRWDASKWDERRWGP